MTIPDAAIEAAAKALRGYTLSGWEAEGAHAAIEAAMPAIREALAQEIEASIKHRGTIFDDERINSNDGKREAARLVRGGTP